MAKEKIKNTVVIQSPMTWQIKGIELMNLSMNAFEIKKPISVFNFNIGAELRADPATKHLFVITHVKIYDNDAPTIEIGSIAVSCIYQIENFEEIVNLAGGLITIANPHNEVLLAVSVSATRGFMASTFKGTALHGATLPILDPKKFARPQAQEQPVIFPTS